MTTDSKRTAAITAAVAKDAFNAIKDFCLVEYIYHVNHREVAEQLHAIAPEFQENYVRYIANTLNMTCCRLIEFPRSHTHGDAERSIASLWTLVDTLPHDTVRDRTRNEVQNLTNLCAPLKSIRNKVLAHTDIHVATGENILEEPEFSQYRDFVHALERFVRFYMKEVDQAFDVDFDFDRDAYLGELYPLFNALGIKR